MLPRLAHRFGECTSAEAGAGQGVGEPKSSGGAPGARAGRARAGDSRGCSALAAELSLPADSACPGTAQPRQVSPDLASWNRIEFIPAHAAALLLGKLPQAAKNEREVSR